MITCIALIRGINVGKAKRIAMADLRAIVAGLGHGNVRTLLNSGNVVFECGRGVSGRLAQSIHEAIATRTGISAQVIVVTAKELEAVILGNPLPDATGEPSRFLVAFVSHPRELERLAPLARTSWSPEQLGIGSHAAYVWCAGGILESKLVVAVMKAMGDTATTRNWSTVTKLQAMASSS